MFVQLGILVKGEKSTEIEFHKQPRQVNYEINFSKARNIIGIII
jgi:hypothetical protein